MASYWKSPYKERPQQPDVAPPASLEQHHQQMFTERQTYDTFVPTGSRTYSGFRKVRQPGPVSPQDWFDWALSVSSATNSISKPIGGKIKGILKTAYGGSEAGDSEKAGPDCESIASLASDSAMSKREKKRVTFGETQERDSSYSAPIFQPDRSTILSSFTRRLKFPQALDDLAKQNARKTAARSGNAPTTANLPSIVGTGLGTPTTVEVGENSPLKHSSSNTCKHDVDLRCAQCVPAEETERLNELSTALSLDTDNQEAVEPLYRSPERKSVGQPDGLEEDEARLQPSEKKKGSPRGDLDLSQEPLKRYRPHWTHAFHRAPRRKNGARLPNRRVPFTPRHFPKASQAVSNVRGKHQISEEFSKLHVADNGKVVGMKLSPDSTPFGSRENSTGSYKFPQSTAITTPGYGTGKDSMTSKVWLRQKALMRVGSAPSRLRDTSRSPQMVACLDKTSQILSWLNDVRSNDQFKPRNARSYQVETAPLI